MSENLAQPSAGITVFEVKGPLTYADVMAQVDWGRAQILSVTQQEVVFDFSAVRVLDSSAVALMLDWCRFAKSAKKLLRLRHLPVRLLSLIRVGGLFDFLPIED